MKKSFSLLLAVLAMATVFMTSCSKSNDAPPTIAFLQNNSATTLPASLATNTDPYAMMAYSYANQANSSLASFAAFMTAPSNAASTGTGSWSWSSGGMTVVYSYTSGASSAAFDVLVSQGGSTLYHMVGTASNNGNTGSINYYFSNMSTPDFVVEWSVTGTNAGSITYRAPGQFREVMTFAADGSGTVTYYNGDPGYREYDFTWTATGSGSWHEYDTDGTTVLGSGTW